MIVWTGNAQAGARLQMLHERQALVLPDLWTFLEKPIFHVKFTTKNKKDNNNKIGQAKQSRSMDCQFNFHPDARICCQVFRPWPSALSTSHVYGLSSGPQVLLPAGFLIHSVGLVFLKVAERGSRGETMTLLPGRQLCHERWAPRSQTLISLPRLSALPSESPGLGKSRHSDS